MPKEIPTSYVIAREDYRDVLMTALQSDELIFTVDDVSDWKSIKEIFREQVRQVGGDDALHSDETSYGFDAVTENLAKVTGNDETACTYFCQMLALVRLPENAQPLEPPVESQEWYWTLGEDGNYQYAAFPDDGIWVWQETDPRSGASEVQQHPAQAADLSEPEAQVPPAQEPRAQVSPAQEDAVLRAVNEVGWRDVPSVPGSAMRLLQDASGVSFLAVTPDGTFVTNDELLRAHGNTRYKDWETLSAAVEAELRPLRAPKDLRHVVVDLMATQRAVELGRS
ncbi:hypothetical protein [Streptomyces sp. NPDC047028]|uniref:hypothetical protein n=1 Tax=Streptomyces sp. NPDC047028 TaxID=3155793 RepID=UPI0033D6EB4E